MALQRLGSDDLVYRIYLASTLALTDIENPSAAELNANATNDPGGLIWNLSCALSTEGSQFDLDDPELDDSTSFCEIAGNGEVISRSATIVYEFFEATERWLDGSSTDAADGFNQATLAKSLLMWPDVEYYAIMSVGKKYDQPFAAGDEVKIARVSTDFATPNLASGAPTTWTQTFSDRGVTALSWNRTVVA